jgi:hypothetical protein
MQEKYDGGPAFPCPTISIGQHQGMTLRDFFAAAAMQSILSREYGRFTTTLDFIGDKAYQYADAMLEAREQE